MLQVFFVMLVTTIINGSNLQINRAVVRYSNVFYDISVEKSIQNKIYEECVCQGIFPK